MKSTTYTILNAGKALEVYLIWQKKIIENRDKSKITKHLIFPICFCQREKIFNFLQI